MRSVIFSQSIRLLKTMMKMTLHEGGQLRARVRADGSSSSAKGSVQQKGKTSINPDYKLEASLFLLPEPSFPLRVLIRQLG